MCETRARRGLRKLDNTNLRVCMLASQSLVNCLQRINTDHPLFLEFDPQNKPTHLWLQAYDELDLRFGYYN